jgi:hypothetical protein
MYLWKQRSLAEQPPQLNMFHFSQLIRTLLLVIGVAGLASAAWAVYRFSVVEKFKTSSEHGSSTQQHLSTLTLCELLANPKAYDMKVIRVRAILVVNHGDRSLYDASCITMDPMVGVEPDPSLHRKPGDRVSEEFYDLVRPDYETKEASARMVMVGRFEGPNFLNDGRKSRFQHQFILMRIEKAEPVTSDATPRVPH